MPPVTRTKRTQEIRLHLTTVEDRHELRCEFVKPAKSLAAITSRGRVMEVLRSPLKALQRDASVSLFDPMVFRRDELWALGLIERNLSEADHREFALIVFVNGFALAQGVRPLSEYVREHGNVDEWLPLKAMEQSETLRVSDPLSLGGEGATLDLSTARGRWTCAVKRKLAEDRDVVRVFNWALRGWHGSTNALVFEGVDNFVVTGRIDVRSGCLGVFAVGELDRVKQSQEQLIANREPGQQPEFFPELGWFVASGYGEGSYAIRTASNDAGQVVAFDITFIYPEISEDF